MCFLFHKWTKWVDKDSGTLAHVLHKNVIGSFITQERRCEKCDKVELRRADTLWA